MNGVPRTLLIPLQQILAECTEFETDAELRSLFREEKLIVFRNRLPSANNITSRVDLVIDYLVPQGLVTGENALVLLLRTLAERYKPPHHYHTRFINLADQLEWLDRADPLSNHFSQEANPNKEPMLQVLEIEQMYKCARSVAHLDVPRYFNGTRLESFSGTAWLITEDLALTCYHVLRARNVNETLEDWDFSDQISNALLTFDFLSTGRGLQYQIVGLEYFDDTLDYALVRIKDRPDCPLSQWGYLILSSASAPLTTQSSLFIIQHPLGQQKQGAFGNYVQAGTDFGRIFYQTPTEHGTSGAPVLNRNDWRVVALHCGEDSTLNLRHGLLIAQIMANLKIAVPSLYQEINSLQNWRI
jgi:hypothetical protein